MKISFCAASLCAFLLTTARADLTIVQNLEGGGSVAAMTMKIKGDRARIDAGPQMTTIIDGKSGEILTLMHDQKKFMRISAAQAKAAAEMATQADDAGAAKQKPQLKATGRKETINGYETVEYVCEAPAFKATYWISTKYPDAAGIMKQMAATTPASWNVAGKGMPDYRDFPGVPLRTRVSFGDKEIVTNLVSIKQDSLPESDFTLPAGFEEMKLPDMDALLRGGKTPRSKTAPSPKS